MSEQGRNRRLRKRKGRKVAWLVAGLVPREGRRKLAHLRLELSDLTKRKGKRKEESVYPNLFSKVWEICKTSKQYVDVKESQISCAKK